MWKKSKNISRNSFSGFARLLACSVCLLLVVSPLAAADWAFLRKGAGSSTPEPVVYNVQPEPEVLEASTQPEVLPEPSQSPSTSSMISNEDSLNNLTEQLGTLSERLNNSIVVTGDLKKDSAMLLSLLETYKKTAEAQAELQEVALENIDALEKKTAELSDQLAKANKTKAYAKVNAVMGFEEFVPTLGFGTTLGVRLGKSFMIEAGANYMFGKVTEFPKLDLTLDNLVVTAGIGWEF